MPFSNERGFGPIIWIPPAFTTNWRLTVERSDGTVDDVTDEIMSLSIEDGATETIGNFEFTIPNTNETYTSAWTGMEIVRYYADYASGTPTTLRFRGRIERPSKVQNNVRVVGRGEALFVFEQTITASYDGKDAGFILKSIFDAKGESRFDTSSIDVSTGTIKTVDWSEKPFWEAVEEICEDAGYDCYVDPDLVVQFFERASVNNTEDAIVHDRNLIETGDFTPDLQFVRNEIRVYGATIDGVQIIYTAKDTASQSTNGIRKELVKDDAIVSYDQAKELGDFLLSNKKDPPTIGDIKAVLLATIQPGENLRISDPSNGLAPTFYRIIKYQHNISQEGLYTIVTLNKETKRISQVFKNQILKDNRKPGVAKNNFDMDFSTIELFNQDSGGHTNTTIVDGVLKKSVAGSDGTWISNVFQSPDGNNYDSVVFRVRGSNIPGATFHVSFDGGVSYEAVTVDTLTTPSSTGGANLSVKIILDDDDSQIDSYEVQFTTQ